MADSRPLLVLPCLLFLAACGSAAAARIPENTPLPSSTSSLTPFQPAADTAVPWVPTPAALDTMPAPTVSPSSTASPSPTGTPTSSPTPEPTAVLTPSATPLPAALGLDPADWHDWPILPVVPERAREIFQLGQTLGRDAHAFSILGDCQSEPKVFLGVYETDPQLAASLTPNLQETIAWFAGSFDRDGPTIRGGTTTGAVLWAQWHQNRYTCTIYESPLTCELRIHNPAFVLIHVGTHYENRNEQYMRRILDQLIAAGVVPILATKADNRELDEHVNAQYARLAVEYNLPFWNFWAAVKDLPKRGLYTRPDATYQGDLYLTDTAAAIHRLSALQTLDLVRRAVTGP